MNKLFRPACLLLYLLTLIAFFFGGMTFASMSGAAEGQGLAGGAIVFMYGLIFAVIAFIASLLFSYFAENKVVKILNWSMFGLILIVAALMFYNNKERQRKKLERDQNKKFNYYQYENDEAKTEPASLIIQDGIDEQMGLGLFKPNFYEHPVLYFYGVPNYEKSVQEHSPSDSIVFKQMETGGFDITYAPPWLVPEHLKLDYDIMYFRVLTIGREFAEVIVNTTDQRTGIIDMNAGQMLYWPEFLMSVNSVEFRENSKEIVRNVPNDIADEIKSPYAFMKPIIIKNDWMKVNLLTDDLEITGTGWIRWRRDNELLIIYSLLS